MACSCAPQAPQERMREADAAFYGEVVSFRDDGADRVYTVRVLRAFKGDLGETIEVRGDNPDGYAVTSCAEVLAVGDRFGLFGTRLDTCSRATLGELEAGARGYPAPTGEGRAVALLAGPFGTAAFAALDRKGRVIAYAPGRRGFAPVTLAPCPGGRFALESSTGRLRVWRLSDLSMRRRLRSRPAESLACADRRGRRAVVARGKRLRLVRARGSRTLWRGRWSQVAAGRLASAVVRRKGRIELVATRTGRVRTARRSGRRPRALELSPDGRRLAVLAGRRLTVYDHRGRRLSARRAAAGTRRLVWTADGRLITLKQSLQHLAAVDDALWWLTQGHLRAAPLGGGDTATLSTLPEHPWGSLVAVPGRPPVRDPGLFSPGTPASAGSRPRARRVEAGAAALRRGCARA